jgi:hypothetical protein
VSIAPAAFPAVRQRLTSVGQHCQRHSPVMGNQPMHPPAQVIPQSERTWPPFSSGD